MTLYDLVKLIREDYSDDTKLLKEIKKLTDNEKTALLLSAVYTIEAVGARDELFTR